MTLIGVHLISCCMFSFSKSNFHKTTLLPVERREKSWAVTDDQAVVEPLPHSVTTLVAFQLFILSVVSTCGGSKNGCCVKTDRSALHEAARLLKTSQLAVHVIQLNNQMRPSFYSPPLFKEAKFYLATHIE